LFGRGGQLLALTRGSLFVRARPAMVLWDAWRGTKCGDAFLGAEFSQGSVSSDGKLVAAIDSLSGRVILVEALSLRELASAEIKESRPVSVCFNGSCDVIACGTKTGDIGVWKLWAGKTQRASKGELGAVFTMLGSQDGHKVFEAAGYLRYMGESTVEFLEDRFPSRAPDQVRRLLEELRSRLYSERELATRRLTAEQVYIRDYLRDVARKTRSLEVKNRILTVLKTAPPVLESEEALRYFRAIWVLQMINSPRAKRILERISTGPQESLLTSEAKEALSVLAKDVSPARTP
jgi:hypothetical protein